MIPLELRRSLSTHRNLTPDPSQVQEGSYPMWGVYIRQIRVEIGGEDGDHGGYIRVYENLKKVPAFLTPLLQMPLNADPYP